MLITLADINSKLNKDIETVLLPTDPKTASISSTLVRKLISLGADISSFVPEPIYNFFKKV